MVCAAHNKTNARNKLNLNAYVSQTVQQITTKLHSQHKYTTTLIRFRRRRSCLSSPTVPAESRPLGGGGYFIHSIFCQCAIIHAKNTRRSYLHVIAEQTGQNLLQLCHRINMHEQYSLRSIFI